jgi:hypothetical protein
MPAPARERGLSLDRRQRLRVRDRDEAVHGAGKDRDVGAIADRPPARVHEQALSSSPRARATRTRSAPTSHQFGMSAVNCRILSFIACVSGARDA